MAPTASMRPLLLSYASLEAMLPNEAPTGHVWHAVTAVDDSVDGLGAECRDALPSRRSRLSPFSSDIMGVPQEVSKESRAARVPSQLAHSNRKAGMSTQAGEHGHRRGDTLVGPTTDHPQHQRCSPLDRY